MSISVGDACISMSIKSNECYSLRLCPSHKLVGSVLELPRLRWLVWLAGRELHHPVRRLGTLDGPPHSKQRLTLYHIHTHSTPM